MRGVINLEETEVKVAETDEKKSYKALWIILMSVSLLVYIWTGLDNANERFSQPVNADKIAYLLGNVFGNYLIGLVVALIVFLVLKLFNRKKKSSYLVIFSAITAIQIFISFVGLINRY